MKKTKYKIHKMDCPSEENLIRMKLSEFNGIYKLEFDISNRELFIYHNEKIDEISNKIAELNLNEKLISTSDVIDKVFSEDKQQTKLLWIVLLINFIFFIIEMLTGLISKSMGLVADSLDMLSDSFVYALSLFAVGGNVLLKKRVAKTSGYFQIILAFIGFYEVIKRYIGIEIIPDFMLMITISILALIANAYCLYILQKSKSKEAHMQASMIFTSNDIIINFGIICAGIMVNVFNSNIPDLVIGSLVFMIVIQGAMRILKIAK